VAVHFRFDGPEVHRSFHLLKVVRHAILFRYNGVFEGADETSPEPYPWPRLASKDTPKRLKQQTAT
jgi:hypothetical protein